MHRNIIDSLVADIERYHLHHSLIPKPSVRSQKIESMNLNLNQIECIISMGGKHESGDDFPRQRQGIIPPVISCSCYLASPLWMQTKSNATNAAQWYWNEDTIDNKTDIENNSQRALDGLPSKQAVANTDSTEATALCQ